MPGKRRSRRTPAMKATDAEIGQRLRLARLGRGLTQQQLAAEIGITFQQIQKYENAHNRISCSMLLEASRALRTSISFFFTTLDPDPAPTPDLSDRALLELHKAARAAKDPDMVHRCALLLRTWAKVKG